MQKQMEGKKPKGNILCLNIVMYIYPKGLLSKYWWFYKKTYQKIIALGNGHSSWLLFSWKCPRVMKFICNAVLLASWWH